LPVPHCVLNMFPEELDPQTEDSSLHGGRIRSFKHEQGNWATYVYLPCKHEVHIVTFSSQIFLYMTLFLSIDDPELEFTDILQELVSVAKRHGIDLTPQEEFHLSLSQTVVLRHHWIQPFTQNLKAGLAHCRRFMCTAERLKVYCNAEKTRTFIGVEVSAGTNQLLDIIKVVDKTMTDFRLDTFYKVSYCYITNSLGFLTYLYYIFAYVFKNPSFHISLAWCIGDSTAQLKSFLKELQ
ncbi:hypothetical protein NL108_008466, partial [Boleophthalmus pectinirostris]